MSDLVIAEDLQVVYERIKQLIAKQITLPWYNNQQQLALIERCSRAEQDNKALREQVERLSAPVSERVWADALTLSPTIHISHAERCSLIIKDRVTEEKLIASRKEADNG